MNIDKDIIKFKGEKNMEKKKTAIILALVVIIAIFNGCSSNTKPNTSKKEVKTIYVGTQNDYPPFVTMMTKVI